jgi:hypothetical protein
VGALKKNIPNKLALMGRSQAIAFVSSTNIGGNPTIPMSLPQISTFLSIALRNSV